MTLKPSKRPTLEEIKEHPWMTGSVPTEAEVKADFEARKGLVDADAKNEREAKR